MNKKNESSKINILRLIVEAGALTLVLKRSEKGIIRFNSTIMSSITDELNRDLADQVPLEKIEEDSRLQKLSVYSQLSTSLTFNAIDSTKKSKQAYKLFFDLIKNTGKSDFFNINNSDSDVEKNKFIKKELKKRAKLENEIKDQSLKDEVLSFRKNLVTQYIAACNTNTVDKLLVDLVLDVTKTEEETDKSIANLKNQSKIMVEMIAKSQSCQPLH